MRPWKPETGLGWYMHSDQGEVNKSQWGEVGSKSALGEGNIKVLFGLRQ